MKKPTKRPRATFGDLRVELEVALSEFFKPFAYDHVPTDHEIQLIEEDLMEICTIQLARPRGSSPT